MGEINSDSQTIPILDIESQGNGRFCIKLSGQWTISNLSTIRSQLFKLNQQKIASGNALSWNLNTIYTLDNAMALLLWQTWGHQLPSGLEIKPEHQRLFSKWRSQTVPELKTTSFSFEQLAVYLSKTLLESAGQLLSFITILGQFSLDLIHLLSSPKDIPWPDISITIYDAGVRALGITALVGFLIGIVLSYLSALQLKLFGAEIYIIDILGLSVIRELGPLLAAILVAGRSGSAMTAQIGIMRVTEELDALSAMGISHSLRLILPKVIALVISMPLLSIWTSAAALIGGMFSAQNTLDISYQQFIIKLPDAVPLLNVFIGLGKSAAFGLMIALIACHFGFRIKPNTESLGNETTNSVVAAITIVIMVDALFAILFMDVGMP